MATDNIKNALKEFDKLLKIDKTNETALLYKAIFVKAIE